MTSNAPVLRVQDAMQYSRLGKTTIFALLKTGALTSVQVGRRRLIHKASLDRLLANENKTPLAA